MAIRIILYELDDDDEPIHDQRAVHYSDNDQLLIGSNKNCDLVLPDISDLALSIYKNNSQAYILEKKENKITVKVNNDLITNESTVLKNGDKIRIDKFLFHFIIEFSKVKHHWNAGVIAYLSTFLIIAILIIELGVITWLPKEIKAKQLWGLEITRQRTLGLMDSLRFRCESSVKNMNTNIERNTLSLIINELDDMSIYLREFARELNAKQLTRIKRDLSIYEDMVDRLENETLYPENESIDAEKYFLKIIRKDGQNSSNSQ